jgi:hypothetical protein
MPWGAVAGAVGSVAASKLLGGSSGGSSTGGNSNAYIPTDRPGVDQNFLANKAEYQYQLGNQQNTISPLNQQLLYGQYNNYGTGAQLGANQAGKLYLNDSKNASDLSAGNWGYANQQMQNAQQQQQLYQQGLGNVQQSTGNLYGAGNQVLQASQDPQNALYNRTAQQLTDQTRAAEYARGIQSSPLGASVESNALGNFNIDWQNQQLQRQAQGLQAAQGAYGAAGNQYTGYLGAMNQGNMQNTANIAGAQQNAFGMGQQAANAYQTGAQLPYQTYQNIYGNQNQALQNYMGNNQTYLSGLNQLQSNDLGYLNNAQSAQNQGYYQNQQNQKNTQDAISSIAGPLSDLTSKDWSKAGDTLSGWGSSIGKWFSGW